MPLVRLLDPDEGDPGLRQREDALSLAQRMPSLVVAAREVAVSVMHGVHGRRRAGAGEAFWQFRPFAAGESRGRIDWRRSARDDRLYVREREWEAAHTVMLWIDRSTSMRFVSKLALQPKIDRAIVLGLAAADLLIRGGERVGLIGLTRAVADRNIVEYFVEALLAEIHAQAQRGAAVGSGAGQGAELPRAEPLPRNAQAVLIGDFLNDPSELAETIEVIGARGAIGHLVMIADPVEEIFPFAGHTEFIDVDSPARLRVGKAESIRANYIGRLRAHREAIRAAARARGWTLMLHRTDRPASEALLGLRMQLEANLSNFAAGHAL